MSVFLKNSTTSEQRAQLAAQVARMPEVQAFAYISRKLALRRLRMHLTADQYVSLPPAGLPASFEIVVKAGDATTVARRFDDSHVVDNDPGTHDGVGFGGFPAKP